MTRTSILPLFLAVATATAFVPSSQLSGLRSSAFFSTKPQTASSTSAEEVEVDLNQEKFLMDMERELGKGDDDGMPVIEADPEYITEARLRFAALADTCDELKEHYAQEVTQLKSKTVWDSFDRIMMNNKNEKSKTGNGAMGLFSLVLAASAVSAVVAVDPSAVSDFLGNIDLDLQLPAVDLSGLQLEKFDMDLDLSSVTVALGEMSSQTNDFMANQISQLDLVDKMQNWQAESSIELAQLQAQMDTSTVELQQFVEKAMASSQINLAQAKESINEAVTSSSVTLAQAQQNLASLGSSWKDVALKLQASFNPGLGNLATSAQQMMNSVQEKASADFKGVQESVAALNFDSSTLTSTGEDLKALLRQ